MATVNFSVPDDVRKAFNKMFAGENKSGILTQLMKRAIEERAVQARREAAFRQLVEGRRRRPRLRDKDLGKLRKAGRK